MEKFKSHGISEFNVVHEEDLMTGWVVRTEFIITRQCPEWVSNAVAKGILYFIMEKGDPYPKLMLCNGTDRTNVVDYDILVKYNNGHINVIKDQYKDDTHNYSGIVIVEA